MKKYLIDTNVLLRLILKDNADQLVQIQDLLVQAETGKVELLCSGISVFEIAFVIMGKIYNLPKAEAVKILQTLLSLKVIKFEDLGVFEMALEIFLKNQISLPDSYLVAKSKLAKTEFFSFDQKANKVFLSSN